MGLLVGPSGNLGRLSRRPVLVETIASEVVWRGSWFGACFDGLDAGSALGPTFSDGIASAERSLIWDKS